MCAGAADAALDRALAGLVRHSDGPPGVAVLVQRGDQKVLHRAGAADLATGAPMRATDSMRLASVSKAFSGAAALSLAAHGALSLGDTVGKWLPDLPRPWSKVTLRELLNHTSGIPDFSQTEAFKEALLKSLLKAPPPKVLLSYAGTCLKFKPGSKYQRRKTSLTCLPQAGPGRPAGLWRRQMMPTPSSARMSAVPPPARRSIGRSSSLGAEVPSRPARGGTRPAWRSSATRLDTEPFTGIPGTPPATCSSWLRAETGADRWSSRSTPRSPRLRTRRDLPSCGRYSTSPSPPRSRATRNTPARPGAASRRLDPPVMGGLSIVTGKQVAGTTGVRP